MSIVIAIPSQTLFLYDTDQTLIKYYPISSALKGLGETKGSEQTPRGEHVIHAKIGADAPIFTVFQGRIPTGELWTPALSQQFPDRDFILCRILWLAGPKTPLDRYIYIHGTSDEADIGKPKSHGCIRMRNQDVIDLFERVKVGNSVLIKEEL